MSLQKWKNKAAKDYTEVSFGALQDAISKAKADKDQNDPALDQANITAMKEAEAGACKYLRFEGCS